MTSLDRYSKVVGDTFDNSEDGRNRQDLIEELEAQVDNAENKTLVVLTLRREQDNPYDRNAVAVLDPEGRRLGYLKAKLAESVAPLLDRGQKVRISEFEITGGDDLDHYYGINIRIQSC